MTTLLSQNKPFFLPTPYFSIPLGLGATAVAWLHAQQLWQWAEIIAQMLAVLATAVWALFICLYVYKIVAYFHQVKEEWHCPVRFSFLALIPISTMIIGNLLYHYQFSPFAQVLIWLGVVTQLLYAYWRIGSLWKGNLFTEDAVQPAFYLPSVASNFTSASSLALLGYSDLSYLFLGAGLIAWVIFEPVLLQRLRVNPIAPTSATTLGIILAPSFVGVSAYLAVNGGEVDTLAKFLWGYGFLQCLFLLRITPWLTQNGFSIGFWAFSFGLASMANSAVSFYQHTSLGNAAIVAFIFANLMIALLITGTLIRIVQRKFWLK